MRAVTKTVLGLGVAGAGVLGWASLVERNAFVLRRFEVPVLPEGSEPLRVLHLSDLHLLPRQRGKRGWVHSLASLDPDLVITTGDNIAAHDAVPALLDAYELLLPLPGVFVLGSNDYFAPKVKNPLLYLTKNHAKEVGTTERLPTAELVRGLASGGWVDLTNRRDTVSVRGLRIDLVGVDDPHLGYDRLDLVRGAAAPDADRLTLKAERGQTEYGVCSTSFLEYAFRTDSYTLDVTFNADGSWSYISDTMLTVRGQAEPFRHRDRNTLIKIAEPTPNPLALIVAGREPETA
jgi:hypothetical protein